MSGYGYSQTAEYVKGKGYNGYVFPKEHAIWGFPPEYNRYTPSQKDIERAEKILKDSIGTDYIISNQTQWKTPPINKRTLKKYVRQYIGYLSENNEIIVCIYLNKDIELGKDKLSEDIISVLDGGGNHWHICINLFTKKLTNMSVNGTS